MRHWPSTGPSRAIRYGGRQRLISEDLPCWGGAVRSRTGRRPAITSSTNWSTALQVSTENQLWRNRGRCTAETKAAKLVRAAMISAIEVPSCAAVLPQIVLPAAIDPKNTTR